MLVVHYIVCLSFFHGFTVDCWFLCCSSFYFSVMWFLYCLCSFCISSRLLPVSLDCPFLIACVSGLSIPYCLCLCIVHSLLPVSLDCPFFIACVSGLSILYCLCLWIVHSLLPVSLNCPFFIACVSGLSILYCLCLCLNYPFFIDSLVFSTVYFR